MTGLWEWPDSSTLTPPNTGEEVEPQECLFSAGGNAESYSIWKTVWHLLSNLNIPLPYNAATTFLGSYPGPEKLWSHNFRTWLIWLICSKSSDTFIECCTNRRLVEIIRRKTLYNIHNFLGNKRKGYSRSSGFLVTGVFQARAGILGFLHSHGSLNYKSFPTVIF